MVGEAVVHGEVRRIGLIKEQGLLAEAVPITTVAYKDRLVE